MTALSIRLLTARSRRAGTPATIVGSSSTLQRRARARACARARRPRSTSRSRRTLLGVRARLLAAGEVDQVVDQQRQLLDLLDDVARAARCCSSRSMSVALLLQDLDVRAQAGDGRAQLVRGVGDELALGVHGGVERAHRALERVEHRVEAAAPAGRSRLRRPARCAGSGPACSATCSVASVRRLSGCTAAPATSRPSSAASAMPPTSSSARIRRRRREQAVDFGQRLGELHGAPGAERLGEHAQVHAVDAGVAEERLRRRARPARACAASTGSDDAARRAQRAIAPLGVDQLLVAAHLVGVGRQLPNRLRAARAARRGCARGARRRRAPAPSSGCAVERAFERRAPSALSATPLRRWRAPRGSSETQQRSPRARGCAAGCRPGCAAGRR